MESYLRALSLIAHSRYYFDDTAKKIELQVGRDLQFIRVNGTIVGALAGIAIHAIGELVVR